MQIKSDCHRELTEMPSTSEDRPDQLSPVLQELISQWVVPQMVEDFLHSCEQTTEKPGLSHADESLLAPGSHPKVNRHSFVKDSTLD